jgi:predicted transcriptional regulator
MLQFWKQRLNQGPSPLGHLENTVMEILWKRGASNVRDVSQCLARPLAYTTVMTTLDRLYKKGLLKRRKEGTAFVYSPLFTRREWEQKRAGDFMAGFLSGPESTRGLLVSCLVDAAGEQDAALLDELEKQIRLKRRELRRRQQ